MLGVYRSHGLSCPACAATLVLAGGTSPVHGCPGCGGAWLDAETAVTLMKGTDEVVSRELVAAASATSGDTSATIADGKRSCARCSAEMLSFSVGDVVVDTCPAHGTWFDRDEVARVAAAVARLRNAEERGEDIAVLPEADHVLGAARIMIGAVSLPFRLVGSLLVTFLASRRDRDGWGHRT